MPPDLPPAPFSDTVPHSRVPLLNTATFVQFPNSASAMPSEDSPSLPGWPPQPSDSSPISAEKFSQPPSPEVSRPSVPLDTRSFPSMQ